MPSWASAEIFPGGGKVDISLILFQVANDSVQMDLRKTLYHESTRFVRIILKSFSGGVVFEFAKRLYFLSSFTAFADLGYNPISLLL